MPWNSAIATPRSARSKWKSDHELSVLSRAISPSLILQHKSRRRMTAPRGRDSIAQGAFSPGAEGPKRLVKPQRGEIPKGGRTRLQHVAKPSKKENLAPLGLWRISRTSNPGLKGPGLSNPAPMGLRRSSSHPCFQQCFCFKIGAGDHAGRKVWEVQGNEDARPGRPAAHRA